MYSIQWASLVAYGKEPASQCRSSGFSPGSGRSPEEGDSSTLSVLVWKIPWMAEPGGL